MWNERARSSEWSKGCGTDRDGCCDLMALFPDRMVCGFGPADRSNGGRDETCSSGSAWLAKPHTCTHTRARARTQLEEWLPGRFTWITEPAETHSVALAFHTLPHTPKKKTSYSGNLWLCADIRDDCWAAFLDEMSHKWVSCKFQQPYDCQTATFVFFVTHFCQVQATGDDSWYILLMSASESCCTDTAMSSCHVFLFSSLSSSPTLLFCSHHRWRVHSFSLLWGCWLEGCDFWLCMWERGGGGDGVLRDAIWGDFSYACGQKVLCIWLSSCMHGDILFKCFHINDQLKDLKLTVFTQDSA